MPVPYPIALENVEGQYPWYVMKSHAVARTLLLSSTPGSAVKRTLSFWTLLCEEDNGTQTYAAGMDRRHHDGVRILWSRQEPYGQWVNPPGPPKHHNWQYFWNTHGLMSSKMKITVIKKMVMV